MSPASPFESNYARIGVYHNDPRDLHDRVNNRSFRVQIHHRPDGSNLEQNVDDILIEGNVGAVITLLNALCVDLVEARALVSLGSGPTLLTSEVVPFVAAEVTEYFKRVPEPLTCFVSQIDHGELVERLDLWAIENNKTP